MEPSEHILLIRAYYDVRVLEPNFLLKSNYEKIILCVCFFFLIFKSFPISS